MLLAYLLTIVGVLWLLQILLQGRLQITLPKIKWQSINKSSQSLSVAVPSARTPVDDEAILGPTRNTSLQPIISNSQKTGEETYLKPTTTSSSHELLEESTDSENGEARVPNEFTDFPTDQDHDNPFGENSDPVDDQELDNVNQLDEGDDDDDPSQDQVVVHTFSDQITNYPEHESKTQPETFEIPFSEDEVDETDVETESLDELISEETSSSDVPLDKYFSQLQTVESILEDIGRSIRRKQSKQTVDQLCRQFTDVLGHYSMLNDKNVMTRVNRVIKPDEAPDHAREFLRLQRESLGLDEEQVTTKDLIEELV